MLTRKFYDKERMKEILNLYGETTLADVMTSKVTSNNKEEEELLEKLLVAKDATGDDHGFWCTLHLNSTKSKISFWGKVVSKVFKDSKLKDESGTNIYIFKVIGKNSDKYMNGKIELNPKMISNIQILEKRDGDLHIQVNMNTNKIEFI